MEVSQSELSAELEKQGFVIYPLHGESIESLRAQGRKFFSVWDKQYPELEQATSQKGFVAFQPDKLYYPESCFLSFNQQEELIAQETREIAKNYPGVTAIRGSVPDWLEIAFQHQDATGKRIFSNDLGSYNYINTSSKFKLEDPELRRIAVGMFRPNRGIEIKTGYLDTPELSNRSDGLGGNYAGRLFLLP